MNQSDSPEAETATRNANDIREVYFVRAMTMGLIKIGVANWSMLRLVSLQTGSPDRLELMGVMVCPRRGALEKQLHWRFAHLRSHGEWYHPAPGLLRFIAENALDSGGAGQLRIRYERGEAPVHDHLFRAAPTKRARPSAEASFARALALVAETKVKAKKPKTRRARPATDKRSTAEWRRDYRARMAQARGLA